MHDSNVKISQSTQWLVRTETEQVKGPYSTEAVGRMILEGIFSGQEDVSTYPDGEWVSLSKQPEFYEVLLESLENPVERDEKRASRIEAETVIRVEEKKDDLHSVSLSDEIRSLVEKEKKRLDIPELPPAVPQISTPIPKTPKSDKDELLKARDKQFVLEMEQIQKIKNKELFKLVPFVVAVALLLGLGGYFLFGSSEDVTTGWVLITPQKNQKIVNEVELKKYKRKAIQLIKTGVLEDFLQAQRQLVYAVEGSEKDMESFGLICVVYDLLWPYTKQNSEDLKAISYVTQKARSANPISPYSDVCQAVYLRTKGLPKEARGLIEKTLDQNFEAQFSLYPFLYSMKADLLEDQTNYIHAEAYYNEATKSFPDWAWAEFGLARMYYKQNKYNDSRLIYEKMHKNNPNSKAALFGLALNEVKGQINLNRAQEFFSQGYAIKSKLPKIFYLEALQEYVKLLLDQKNKSKALEVARLGLQISPSHKALQDIVINLGGDENVKGYGSVAELILVGDQFARSGDHLAAQAQFKAAFDLDPKNASIAAKTAKSLWSLNQTREAISWIDRAIKLDLKNVSYYTLKADYLSQKFNFLDASKALQEAQFIDSKNFEVLKTQALIEYRKNNISGALAYGERAQKIYDADVELLTLLAKVNVDVFLNAPSRTTEEQDKKKDSIAAAQKYAGKAVDLEPGWPESQITYAKYINATQGNIKAENYLKELIKSFPYTVEYRQGLAEFYEEQEKYKSAEQIYQQLMDSDPKNKKAVIGLARSLKGQNLSEQAQKQFLNAALLDPSDVEPMYETAQLQLERATTKGNNVEINLALNKLKAVRSINPNYPKISITIAKALLELGLFQEAVDMIKEEKTKNPNMADSYLLAAEVYDRKGQYKECAAEYSYAIKLRMNSADLYVKAASCYRKSDSLDIAQDMLDIAKQKESGYPGIYKEYGYVYEKKNLSRQAKESFLIYLELSPNAMDRAEIESRISHL